MHTRSEVFALYQHISTSAAAHACGYFLLQTDLLGSCISGQSLVQTANACPSLHAQVRVWPDQLYADLDVQLLCGLAGLIRIHTSYLIRHHLSLESASGLCNQCL